MIVRNSGNQSVTQIPNILNNAAGFGFAVKIAW